MKRLLLFCISLSLLLTPLFVTVAQDRNVFVYGHPVAFPNLDPSSGNSNENVVMGNVYETLTFYNAPGSDVILSPKLAVSWEASEDSLTWTFNLREGVTFHDGAALNAEAVKKALDRTISIGEGSAWIFWMIDSIEAVDELVVQFNLNTPAPLDLVLSAGYAAWIMSPNAADQDNAWFNDGNAAGTGPYRIASNEPSQRMVLEAYPDYWGGWSESQFDTIVFEIVEDSTVLEQMIRSGDADFTYSLPFDNYGPLADASGLSVVVTPSFQNLLILLNTVKEPTSNKLVRQALSYSFPYADVVSNLYAGLGTQARGPIPANMWGHGVELLQYSHDLDKARELLAEAGYPDGGFSLVYTHVASDLDEQQVGELWRASLAEIGVDLEIRGLAWQAQWDLAINDPASAQEAFGFYWWPDYITPNSWLTGMFVSEDEPFFNLSYYSNPEFDDLVASASTMSGTDRAAAEEMYLAAQELLLDDAAAIYVVDLPDIHVIRDDVSGYVNNPGYPHVVFFYDLTR